MEIIKAGSQPTFTQRATALVLAFATTAFIATSVVAVFTGSAQLVGSSLVRVATAPLRVFLGY